MKHSFYKQLFGLSILLFLGINAVYSQTEVLTIYKTDGTNVQIPFQEKPVISFSKDSIFIVSKKLVVSYKADDVKKYTVNETQEPFPENQIIINDDELESYYNQTDIPHQDITYIRTFQDTNWQALYVPFEISVASLIDEFEVAVINNFHQYDDNKDGIFDRTVLEICQADELQTLMANYPYLIKAKEPGKKSITTKDATLYATELYSIDCSSVELKYTFTGTYNKTENLRQLGYYYLEDGHLGKAYTSSKSLPAFRWYMTITARASQYKDNPIILESKDIQIQMIDEETSISDYNDGKTTNIQHIYTTDGIKVAKPTQDGIYIMKMTDGSTRKHYITH